MTPTIYLAGPSVFDADWADQAAAMKAACAARGAIGVYPNDNQTNLPSEPFAHAIAIFDADRDAVIACDGLVADFTPFRGPSADTGTVWEFAFAQGLGKATAAFSRDRSPYEDRLRAWLPDDDGRLVDAFDLADSLMVIGANLQGDPARRAATVRGLYGSFEEALDAVLAALRART